MGFHKGSSPWYQKATQIQVSSIFSMRKRQETWGNGFGKAWDPPTTSQRISGSSKAPAIRQKRNSTVVLSGCKEKTQSPRNQETAETRQKIHYQNCSTQSLRARSQRTDMKPPDKLLPLKFSNPWPLFFSTAVALVQVTIPSSLNYWNSLLPDISASSCILSPWVYSCHHT